MTLVKCLPQWNLCCCFIELRFGLVLCAILESYVSAWFVLSSSFSKPEVWIKTYELNEDFINKWKDEMDILFYTLIVLSVAKFVLNFMLLDGIFLGRTYLVRIYIIGGIIFVISMVALAVIFYLFLPYKTIEIVIQLTLTTYTVLCANNYIDRMVVDESRKNQHSLRIFPV